jgi:two-component system cell cycle sensor histidine kinase/response regulator CckA
MSVEKQCHAAVTASPDGRGAVKGYAAAARVAAPCGQRQRVLLVEDDDILRRLIRLILLGNGFEVVEAGRGSEALSLSQADPNAFHLLVTDLILPGMDGHKVAAQLRQQRPDLKVLFISGNAEEIAPREGRADFLQKPFTPTTFIAAVSRLLER